MLRGNDWWLLAKPYVIAKPYLLKIFRSLLLMLLLILVMLLFIEMFIPFFIRCVWKLITTFRFFPMLISCYWKRVYMWTEVKLIVWIWSDEYFHGSRVRHLVYTCDHRPFNEQLVLYLLLVAVFFFRRWVGGSAYSFACRNKSINTTRAIHEANVWPKRTKDANS